MATSKSSKKTTSKPPISFFHGGLAKARGTIDVSNIKKKEEQILIEFANTDLQTKQEQPLSALKLNQSPHFIKGDSLQLKVPLSRSTPPGSHKVDILINGNRQEAIFEIEERVSVYIKPNLFFIEAPAGSQVNKTVYVTNNGNIPLRFSDPGPVMLESQFLECRALREVVRTIDKKEASLDRAIGLFAEKLEQLYDEASALRVRLKGKAPDIQAGSTQKIDLVISLPSNLKSPNQYTGSFRFYNALIQFRVIPQGKTSTIK